MLSRTFGDRVRSFRKQRKISQENLGFLTGYSTEYISQIENGTGNPTLEVLEVMMTAFSCSVEALLKESERTPSDKERHETKKEREAQLPA